LDVIERLFERNIRLGRDDPFSSRCEEGFSSSDIDIPIKCGNIEQRLIRRRRINVEVQNDGGG
jgi:hypothetical protein